MAEWQDIDSAQVWSEPVSLSPAKDAEAFGIAQAEIVDVEDDSAARSGDGRSSNGNDNGDDGDDDDDDFGGFGNDTNNSANSDDFGDFGDFGDFNDFATGQVIVPVPEPTPAVLITPRQPKSEKSPVDKVLETARPLLDSTSDESFNTRRLAALSECLEQSFMDDGSTVAPTTNGLSSDRTTDLDDLNSICRSIQSQEYAIPPDEPRLLRNLTLTLVDPKIPDTLRDRLLLPLSDLHNLPGYASDQEALLASSLVTKTALLDIDHIRQLVAQDCADPDTLKHALLSINALISTKEQELDKRKDAVVAYNQVIQTLVLQAKRLH